MEELDCLEALDRYDPEFVLTSWLDSDAGQKNIIDRRSVRTYIEIGLIGDQFKFLCDRSGEDSDRFPDFDVRVLESAQRYSLPVNLFIPYIRKSYQSENRGLTLLNELFIPFKEDNEAFMMRHPSVHLWTLKE